MKPSELIRPIWAQYPRIRKDLIQIDHGHVTGCCAMGAFALAVGVKPEDISGNPKYKISYQEIAEKVDETLGCTFLNSQAENPVGRLDLLFNDVWRKNDAGQFEEFAVSDDELLAWLDQKYEEVCSGQAE